MCLSQHAEGGCRLFGWERCLRAGCLPAGCLPAWPGGWSGLTCLCICRLWQESEVSNGDVATAARVRRNYSSLATLTTDQLKQLAGPAFRRSQTGARRRRAAPQGGGQARDMLCQTRRVVGGVV